MKKFYLLAASMLAFWACSDSQDSNVISFEDSKAPVEAENSKGVSSATATDGEVVVVGVADAKAHVGLYRHSVVNSWNFADAESAEKLVSVPVDSAIQNGDFAVDADVVVKNDSLYTIASAGLDGEGSSWMIQVENKEVIFSWRIGSDDDWHVFKTGACLQNDELNNVRIERAGNMTVISVNGEVKGAFTVKGRFSSVKGSFTIGYDEGESENLHCDNGEVEQINVESVDSLEEVEEVVVPEISADETEFVDDADTSATDSMAEEAEEPVDWTDDVESMEWIAVWNFDDSSNVGFDATGNGHQAKKGEGSVSSVNGIAKFNGASGFVVSLTDDLVINEFVVEARVKLAKYGRMQNIIVAEPPGRGVDGWQLRVDEGALTFHIRDNAIDYDDWNIFTGKIVELNEWTVIRVERSNDSVKVFQDGELTIVAAYKGDVTQMHYDWGIGYDAMQQAYHNRYFDGEMDYIRFGKFNGFSAGVLKTPKKTPLAAWEFNEPLFVGLDKMANNSTHYLVGFPVVVDSTVKLDGKSGLKIPLSKIFKRNEFSVEARVKPTAFGGMQNIIVAEPPGRYYDGWIIRADDGVLTVHFRDENVDGTEWNILEGEKLDLNEWNVIRVERTADSIKVFQNGHLTASAASKGDVSQISYDIGIGYDAMMQANHDRYFVGEMDYIRFYGK